ncbi:putative ankyrin repeat protein RF_0381 [Cloeon dipterum]|uniref:putative ankyrin repeat protein RF_0381 n=1 Tax=Cloeon dipterum TaxID=197152 RepID=UPI00321F92EB
MDEPLNTVRFQSKIRNGFATQLMLAAKSDDLESCLRVLERSGGAHLKTKRDNVSLLHFAAVNKTHGLEIIRHFTQLGLSLTALDVDDEEPIHYAIRMGDYDFAKKLLKMRNPTAGFNLLHFSVMVNNLEFAKAVNNHDNNLADEFDAEGRKVLHLAAEFGDLEMFSWVMNELGSHPNQVRSAKNASALHHVVLNQHHAKEIISFLANLNVWSDSYPDGMVDVDARNASDVTPLQMALSLGRVDVAQDLVQFGANVNFKWNGKNLLHLCVEANKLRSAKLVHNWNNKKILERDSTGRSVIHIAAENADRFMCEWLFEKGAVVTALCYEKRCSALHCVGLNVNYGNKDLIRFFKTLGFSLEKRDNEDLTPLHYALRAGNLKVASDMITLGADLRVESNRLNLLQYCVRHNYLESAKFIHEKDGELIKKLCEGCGRTVLHMAAEYADEEMCRWLVGQGVSASTLSGDKKNNVLHYAALNFTHGGSLVNYFLSLKLAPNVRNNHALEPLHVALERENLKVAEELLNHGANINLLVDDKNLLNFCASRNRLDAAKFVHERNPELIKGLCLAGNTALHIAAQFCSFEFGQWLVENGVDPKARNDLGHLAWQYVPDVKKDLQKYLKKF